MSKHLGKKLAHAAPQCQTLPLLQGRIDLIKLSNNNANHAAFPSGLIRSWFNCDCACRELTFSLACRARTADSNSDSIVANCSRNSNIVPCARLSSSLQEQQGAPAG